MRGVTSAFSHLSIESVSLRLKKITESSKLKDEANFIIHKPRGVLVRTNQFVIGWFDKSVRCDRFIKTNWCDSVDLANSVQSPFSCESPSHVISVVPFAVSS